MMMFGDVNSSPQTILSIWTGKLTLRARFACVNKGMQLIGLNFLPLSSSSKQETAVDGVEPKW